MILEDKIPKEISKKFAKCVEDERNRLREDCIKFEMNINKMSRKDAIMLKCPKPSKDAYEVKGSYGIVLAQLG